MGWDEVGWCSYFVFRCCAAFGSCDLLELISFHRLSDFQIPYSRLNGFLSPVSEIILLMRSTHLLRRNFSQNGLL